VSITSKASGVVAAAGVRQGRLYYLLGTSVRQQTALTANACQLENSFQLWHQRYGHVSGESLAMLKSKEMVSGLSFQTEHMNLRFCQACAEGKQHANPVPKVRSSAKEIQLLALVHTDVSGPMKTISTNGYRFFVTFIDDASRYTKVYFMRHKDEVAALFKEYRAAVENFCSRPIKILRSDNGGEYMSREMLAEMKEAGIIHQLTAPYTPQQNGVAERSNRTIIEMARSMLCHARLPLKFWPEAVATAVHIKNRSTHKAIPDKTPEEVWSGEKPDVSHFRVFGCSAYALVPAHLRSKLDPKSRRCLFLGYNHDSGSKSYRLYDPEAQRMLSSRDVLFDEEIAASGEDANQRSEQQDPLESLHQLPVADHTPAVQQQPNTAQVGASLRRSIRERRPARHYDDDYGSVAEALIACSDEPMTLQEALSSSDAQFWQTAIDEELASLQENDVYEVTQLPDGRRAIGSKFVFRVKRNADGSVNCYKARLVAKGYSQVDGVDFTETFAPVVKFNSLRTVLAIAAMMDLEIHQMDVKTAFLNGDLEEEIYLEQPEVFPQAETEKRVWRLKKSLYGLKQAPRAWNRKLDHQLRDMGFLSLEADNSLYRRNDCGDTVFIAVYVDDLILCGTETGLFHVKQRLSEAFAMKDLGEAHWILGIQVSRNRSCKTVTLNQTRYIMDILQRYGMDTCKPVFTPADAGITLAKDMTQDSDEQADYMRRVPYRSAVGSLMYLTVATRPDIAAAVGIVSRYTNQPCSQHWIAVKRILRYLQGTANWCLDLSADPDAQLRGYCDADWANDPDTRCSVTGYVFSIGKGSITWSSKRQTTVALSTTEAEYMALSHAAREAIWLRQLLKELGFEQTKPTEIYSDNQGCIALVANPIHHARTKHIDVRHHFVRQLHSDGAIQTLFCRSEENAADFLTKPLGKHKHAVCATAVGLRPLQ